MGVGIDIQRIVKRYPSATKNSLNEVSLTINPGSKFGILGPNGAGKTTLISIICGIIDKTEGNIAYYNGEGEIDYKAFRKTLGFVPQDYALFQELTPRQNLEYFGALYNLGRKEIARQTDELLAKLGLSAVADHQISTFSGGMKRRINLAIGIIHQPQILVLDEPTVGVDVQSKNAIMKLLDELNAHGTTIIYTSHHLSEAQEFCNEIALIDMGKIILSQSMVSLLHEHKTNSLKEVFLELTGEEYRDSNV
jgi:ABC-2 type transport system ATP-binding protein